MNIIKDICCICLKNVNNVRRLYNTCENLNYYSRLIVLFPEMASTVLYNQGEICLECCSKINDFYQFREQCLRNSQTYISYTSQLSSVSETSREMCIDLTDSKEEQKQTKKNCGESGKVFNTNHFLTERSSRSTFPNEELEEFDKTYTVKTGTKEGGTDDIHHDNTSSDIIITEEINIKSEPVDTPEFEYVQEDATVTNADGTTEKVYPDKSKMEFNIENIYIKSEPAETSEFEDEMESTTVTNTDDIHEGVAAASNILPCKSREKYEAVYAVFENWRKTKKMNAINEEVILAFLTEKSQNLKSSSLWSTYSMLKSTLMLNKNINIRFPKVLAFLKKQSVGYKAKKSKGFSREEIDAFLLKADDFDYLMMKVVLIVGLAGGLRREELCKLSLDNIEDKNTILVMKIPDTKTNIERTFIVVGQNNIALFKKYVALRPPNTPHRRLFVFYKYGKCSVQPVGLNTFGKIPSKIAAYLMLPNPEQYTGHSLRRSSASVNQQM